MEETIKDKVKTGIICAVTLVLMFAVSGGCKAPDKVSTIGIVTYANTNVSLREGFNAGLAEQGYVEGRNVRYIYAFITEDNDQMIDSKIRGLLSQDLDLIFAMGKLALSVKELVKGDMPILFAGNAYPVETGLVQSLKRPGGNITGVKAADGISKALEWLVTIANGAKKIYLPYNPDDPMAIMELPRLNKAASQLGIELVIQKFYSVEEAAAAIENLPQDIDAVFMILSRILNRRNSELSSAAIKRGIPTGSPIQLDEDVLVTLTSDFYDIGKKNARLAQQILQGAKPSDLPVETADTVLTINLKTAERIGLNIPDSILAQATTIIR
jgi:putative ABC transport system substrate-binding protein